MLLKKSFDNNSFILNLRRVDFEEMQRIVLQNQHHAFVDTHTLNRCRTAQIAKTMLLKTGNQGVNAPICNLSLFLDSASPHNIPSLTKSK